MMAAFSDLVLSLLLLLQLAAFLSSRYESSPHSVWIDIFHVSKKILAITASLLHHARTVAVFLWERLPPICMSSAPSPPKRTLTSRREEFMRQRLAPADFEIWCKSYRAARAAQIQEALRRAAAKNTRQIPAACPPQFGIQASRTFAIDLYEAEKAIPVGPSLQKHHPLPAASPVTLSNKEGDALINAVLKRERPPLDPLPRASEQQVRDVLAYFDRRRALKAALEKERLDAEERYQANMREKRRQAEETQRAAEAALAAREKELHAEQQRAREAFFAMMREPGNGSLFPLPQQQQLLPPPPPPPHYIVSDVAMLASAAASFPQADCRDMAPPPRQQQPALPLAGPIVGGFAPATAIFPQPPIREMPPPAQQQQHQQQQRQAAPPAARPDAGSLTSAVGSFSRAGSGETEVKAPVRTAIAVQPPGGVPSSSNPASNPSAPSNPLAAAAPEISADNPLKNLTPLAARARIGDWANKIATDLNSLELRRRVNSNRNAWLAFRRADEGRDFLRRVKRQLGWVMEWAIDPKTLERDNAKLTFAQLEMYGLKGTRYYTLLTELRAATGHKKDSDERLEEALATVLLVSERLH